ncbi:MAG: BatA domain-containing protein, partial [Bdellovibrionaceae bacterium]|nr:BatA domain-containing protein [Pseudobdellovibrionaceae bacterium]
MREWHTPEAFFLILPILAALYWAWKMRAKKTPTLQYSSLSTLRSVSLGWRSRLSQLPTLLKVVALLLAVVALARPREASTKVKKNVEGIDIVIALDVSDSMLIEDMKPENRLECAKETIRRFVEGRSSDRIGIV